MSFQMVADHAVRERKPDVTFGIMSRANNAIAKYGAENVINSTIGALLDDEGKLVALESVYSTLKALDNASFAAYAPIEGEAKFLNAVVKACFKEYRPEGFIKAIATPGGTGAVHHAICNYTNVGDTFLTSDWYWGPYATIGEENNRKLDTFTLLDENNNFNFESYKNKFEEILTRQKRILVILNTPAHNPTGYSVTNEEWDAILNLAKEHAKNIENKIIICCDIAYIDFAEPEKRSFMKKFSNLPVNIMSLFAFSASKGYTMYGLRNGALICVTPDEDTAEEFYFASTFSNRANWSNGTKCAMKTLAEIQDDEELLSKFTLEQDKYRLILKLRADKFIEESARVGLKLTSYSEGFFVCVPCDNPKTVCEKLTEENLFVVPFQYGIRVALCAINVAQAEKMPKIIKKVLETM